MSVAIDYSQSFPASIRSLQPEPRDLLSQFSLSSATPRSIPINIPPQPVMSNLESRYVPRIRSVVEIDLESVQPDLFGTRFNDVSVAGDQPVKVPSGDDLGIPGHGTTNSTVDTISLISLDVFSCVKFNV
jgi:hypothetical protein